MKKRISKKMALVITMTGMMALGGAAAYTSAYLTDHENVVNEFTVGKVDIKLEEPNWDEDENTKIQPSEEIEKDPQITNVGKNDAFVYLEVSIPMKDVIAANADGTRQEKKLQELFSFHAGSEWNLLKKEQSGSDMVYIYNYTKILEPEKTTQALFETVTFLNVIEGQMDLEHISIPVKAYAIQTENTGDNGETINDKASAAYVKYMNQNKNQDGQVTVETAPKTAGE